MLELFKENIGTGRIFIINEWMQDLRYELSLIVNRYAYWATN